MEQQNCIGWFPEMDQLIRQHICVIEFVKVDGTLRKMICTLDMTKVPQEQHPKGTGYKIDDSIRPVYDLEAKDWRRFKKANVVSFNVIY